MEDVKKLEDAKDPVTREFLEKFGFLPKLLDDMPGTYWVKNIFARDMPYMRENVVDDDLLYDDDIVIVEVGPENTVQISVVDSNYREERVPLDSEEARDILKDAGVIFDND